MTIGHRNRLMLALAVCPMGCLVVCSYASVGPLLANTP